MLACPDARELAAVAHHMLWTQSRGSIYPRSILMALGAHSEYPSARISSDINHTRNERPCHRHLEYLGEGVHRSEMQLAALGAPPA